ncbi:MAG: hypothetical protein OHK0045_20060 [Raineya sp.]
MGILVSFASGQVVLKPISHKNIFFQKKITQHRSTPLNLPFFDDFLGTEINENLWQNAGAIITNGIALNPKSRGVATLDSYNLRGESYNISSPLAEGFSDTLTSQSIDLSGFTPADSIFLSFFVQPQGLGETPDEGDFLRVDALNDVGQWQSIWQKNGNPSTSPNFEIVILRLDQSQWLHSNFRFRFMRYGRLSGNFDVWHIDYVYLNNNRNSNDICFPDIATTQSQGSYLKNYSAMPAKHFFNYNNPAELLNDAIDFKLKNLDCNFRVINYNAPLIDTISQVQVATLPIATITGSPFIIEPTDNYTLRATPQLPSLPISTTKAVLATRLEVATSDGNTLIPPIDFRKNDTIIHYTTLDNYYAYDDGEAEYVVGVNQRLGRIALRYVIMQEAQLSDLDIAFVPFEKDLSNQTFVLSVWKSLQNRNQEVLFQRSFQVKYPNKPNGFVRFPIDSFQVLAVKDTIFVGIQQTTDDLLAIGFDANNNSFQNVFFNVAGIWEQDNNLQGSIMIRPVFRGDAITALQTAPEKKVNIYPNPAKNLLNIEGLDIKDVWITDLQGRKLPSSWQLPQLHFTLPKGVYLLHILSQEAGMLHRKIVVE